MSTTAPASDLSFQPLIQLDMDVGAFASDWTHCDRISSYAARMVSHDRSDSLLYSNLFSSALNELLETVFRAHARPGRFVCAIARSANVDRIRLQVPCDGPRRQFYDEAVAEISRADAAERYRAALLSPGPLSPFIGLLELAVDYAALISVETGDDDSISIIADLALEGPEA